MEEQILIKSEHYKVKVLLIVLMALGALLSLVLIVNSISESATYYDSCYETYLEHQEDGDCGWSYYYSWNTCYECELVEGSSKAEYIAPDFVDLILYLLPFIGLSLIGLIVMLILRSFKLTVTNKRVIGQIIFGRRITLPVDSITAVATARLSKSISISTPSGRIYFSNIKNAAEIYDVINDLIIERT